MMTIDYLKQSTIEIWQQMGDELPTKKLAQPHTKLGVAAVLGYMCYNLGPDCSSAVI
jgi:hypothetical protein